MSFKEDVLARIDVLTVVGRYVDLKKKGSDYWGLCPFHMENSPSFHVMPDRGGGVYKCFGCQKGGVGPINFLMEIENLSYYEALEQLGREVGLQMPQQREADVAARNAKEKLYGMNKIVARFYMECLRSPMGQEARNYLDKRGLSYDTRIQFALGYAPDGWDFLLKHMSNHGFTVPELLDAGLVKQNERGNVYDRFRNRVMFPVVDVSKHVIGFGGRTLEAESKGAKYLNSPDTAVYDKSRSLFGLNFAKTVKDGTAIITEGYMDAIALHQAGFQGAVASCGTAFTEGQAQMLQRYCKKAIIAFDSDGAGVSATNRAIPILEKAGISARVLEMTDAKDPDEYIKKNNSGMFAHLLTKSVHHLDYRMNQMKKRYDLENTADKVSFMKEISEFLATVENPSEREIYADKAATVMGINIEAILIEVGKEMVQIQNRQDKQLERERNQPKTGGTPGAQAYQYQHLRLEKAEEGLLCVLSLEPLFFQEMEEYTYKDFFNPILGRCFQMLKERFFQGMSTDLSMVSEYFSSSEMNYLVSVLDGLQDLSNLAKARDDYLRIIEDENELLLCSGEDELLVLQQMIEDRRNRET